MGNKVEMRKYLCVQPANPKKRLLFLFDEHSKQKQNQGQGATMPERSKGEVLRTSGH